MKFNEQYTVENYVIDFLKNKLGYKYIKPKVFSDLREFENEFLIISHLSEAIGKINEIKDKTEIQSVIREVKKLDTNEDFLNVMRNGIDLINVETKRTKNYKLIDFENIENNKFIITNQFYFEGNSENIRTDILVFLNGLPLSDIEAKSPTVSEGVNYENAVDQIKRYEKSARKLFLPNCFNIATDGLKTVYGATYSPKQYFFTWKDENKSKKTEDELERTLTALLSKNNLLDIIKNFILFEKEKEERIKKIARYQQIKATNKVVDRVGKGKTKRGLIWHTQGSGKSLTMFFTAWKLRFAKELKNPKVFILVDRIDLDDQLTDTFVNCGGQSVFRIISRKNLAKKIVNDERGIFISTIQKFNNLPAGVENKNENIIVLCDEGHRTNEGFASINLRSAMKNAFFFGFTGTPIDKATLNTHRNFGEKGERYLDYYSIQQAIDDGATLPVVYEARMSKFSIDEEKIDKQFDKLTINLSDKQKNTLSKKYGKKGAIVKLDKRMEAIIQDIIEHYKLYVEPNGFKAQIVCYDREATAKYKELLDKFIPEKWSKVIYSSGDPNSSSDELKKYNTSKAKRERIIEEFKNPKSSLKFLLVCDMLLTGFDAPIEQVMYLDKQLCGHKLLQAIARTNRIYPNKGCGKVIDYYGITKNLYQALDFDESIVDSAMINIDNFKKEFIDILNKIMKLFKGVDVENPSMLNLRKCLRIFINKEKKQKSFYNEYGRLKLLFEILSPDPFLKEFLRKFEWLTSFYLAFMKEFKSEEKDFSILEEYGEKVKNLIQEKVEYEGITKNFRQLNIHEIAELEKRYFINEEERALNLEKMLKQEISANLETDLIFEKFSERLTIIKNKFEQNQIDLSERIKRYYELIKDIREKDKKAEKLGYNLKEYGLYSVSKDYIDISDKEIVKQFIKEMSNNLDDILDNNWQESSKREEFLKEIKKMLQELILKDYKNKVKVKDFHKYLNRLVDVIIKKF